MAERNWGGNHEYPSVPIRPTSVAELAQLVVKGTDDGSVVRAVGSRHSFNGIADAELMVDLTDMPELFQVHSNRQFVDVSASMTYGRFAELAGVEDIALHNLASLPHISIAGAVATGTHGSGSTNGNLSTAVIGMEIMDSTGTLLWFETEDDLQRQRVNLGATGIVTRVRLRCEPAYEIEQRVYDNVTWDDLGNRFDEIFGCAYSVSAFTRWGVDSDEADVVAQLWVKRRIDQPGYGSLLDDMGATPAGEKRHPIKGMSGDACTEQFGVPGRWSDRLPHFRTDFTPSAGEEIQTEYFIARSDAPAGIKAIRLIAHQLDEAMLTSEIRTVAADNIFMSPCFERDSVAFHFTWRPDQAASERAAAVVLHALLPFHPRPHWGKVFPAPSTGQGTAPGTNRFLGGIHGGSPFINRWFRERVGHPRAPNLGDSQAQHIGRLRESRIGLGTFGSDHVSHSAVADAVHFAIHAGYRFIDCASVYGNEAEIGNALAAGASVGLVSRQHLFISSKVWNDQHHEVSVACEKSIHDLQLGELNRLYFNSAPVNEDSDPSGSQPVTQVEIGNSAYLDLYLTHWPFPNHHPPHCDVAKRNPDAVPYDHGRFMDTWRQLEELVDRGRARAIGTSNMTISKLDRLLEDARIPPAANQMELHPHFQQPELFDYLIKNDIVPIGFCPIGSPGRPERDRTPEDTNPTEDPVIVEIARRHGVHPAIICIKWAVQRGQIPIPFSTTLRNIEANLSAIDSPPLTDVEMASIAEIDKGNRLIKGQVFLWPDAKGWSDLWL